MKNLLQSIGYYMKAFYKPLYMHRMRKASIGITLLLILGISLLRSVPAQANIEQVVFLQDQELLDLVDNAPDDLLAITGCNTGSGDEGYYVLYCENDEYFEVDLDNVLIGFNLQIDEESQLPDEITKKTIYFIEYGIIILNVDGAPEQYLYTEDNFRFRSNYDAEQILDELIYGIEEARAVVFKDAMPIMSLFQTLMIILPLSLISWFLFKKREIMVKYKEYLNVSVFAAVIPSILAFSVGWFSPSFLNATFNVAYLVTYLFSMFSILVKTQKTVL